MTLPWPGRGTPTPEAARPVAPPVPAAHRPRTDGARVTRIRRARTLHPEAAPTPPHSRPRAAVRTAGQVSPTRIASARPFLPAPVRGAGAVSSARVAGARRFLPAPVRGARPVSSVRIGSAWPFLSAPVRGARPASSGSRAVFGAVSLGRARGPAGTRGRLAPGAGRAGAAAAAQSPARRDRPGVWGLAPAFGKGRGGGKPPAAEATAPQHVTTGASPVRTSPASSVPVRMSPTGMIPVRTRPTRTRPTRTAEETHP